MKSSTPSINDRINNSRKEMLKIAEDKNIALLFTDTVGQLLLIKNKFKDKNVVCFDFTNTLEKSKSYSSLYIPEDNKVAEKDKIAIISESRTNIAKCIKTFGIYNYEVMVLFARSSISNKDLLNAFSSMISLLESLPTPVKEKLPKLDDDSNLEAVEDLDLYNFKLKIARLEIILKAKSEEQALYSDSILFKNNKIRQSVLNALLRQSILDEEPVKGSSGSKLTLTEKGEVYLNKILSIDYPVVLETREIWGYLEK